MLNKKLATALLKCASTDRNRENLTRIHVTETCAESTDGHRALRVTGPHEIAPGVYDPKDWHDLVCQGRQATPIVAADTFPDMDQVIPVERAPKEAPATSAIGLDLSLLTPVAGLVKSWRVSIPTDDLSPIRMDATSGEFELIFVAMPFQFREAGF